MTAPRRTALEWVARVLALVGAVYLLVAVRVMVTSGNELSEARALEAAGRVDDAIVHFRRSARMYVPGNAFASEALDALIAIGQQAQTEGASKRALAAFRSVRAAVMSTRSFYVPNVDALEAADRSIGAIEVGGRGGGAPLRTVVRRDDPHRAAAALGLVGFIGWVVAAFRFVREGIDEEDRVVAAKARKWGLVGVLAMIAFGVGLALA